MSASLSLSSDRPLNIIFSGLWLCGLAGFPAALMGLAGLQGGYLIELSECNDLGVL